ncbi:sulfotransferase family protein [Roseofilum casamattae]|uniref:Sulfotransferase n=1 Tax=Roseofilum casamattae BLCC-M143 TaxID=3022442 RepID=A0ABT7BVE5_9CYAN|nr:sulfotransferase [Roseofilum casamattae]MDJ1183165.1 sulfotransferase [Roseofilum casamattae BLCC-M143]
MSETLPNFLIIGAPKAGTTSLYRYLNSHPQIFLPEKKEPHFFSFEGRSQGFNGPGQEKFMQKRVTTWADYCRLFSTVNDEIAIGEASTSYLYVPEAADRIQHYLPDVKLIAMLRQPVDRAFSNYMHHYRNGGEIILDFAEAFYAEEQRMADGWSPFWQYKSIGLYARHLQRYFDRFDREQIRVYWYDDFTADPIGVVKDIFSFLNVGDRYLPDTSKRYNVSYVKKEPRSKTIHNLLNRDNVLRSTVKRLLPQQLRQRTRNFLMKQNTAELDKPYQARLSPSIRQSLTQDYHQDILNLQDLLSKDLSAWLN